MNSLIIAFQVVFPVLFYILLGCFMKHINMLDEHSLNVMNKVTFRLFLPVLVFMNILKMDLKNFSDLYYILYIACSILIVFIASVLIIPYLEKSNKKRGVLVQGIFRNNFLIFGTPITALLCGENQVGIVAVLTVVVIPMCNMLGVISFELFKDKKPQCGVILKNSITNPLIIASFIAGAFLLFGIKIPNILEYTLTEISKVTTPFALILLGGSLHFNTIKSLTRQLVIGLLGRLVIVPLIFILLAIFLGFRGAELVAIMTVFATPNAVSSYTMAKEMGGDCDLAGQLVVFSTTISIFTIFVWVSLLKYFSLI